MRPAGQTGGAVAAWEDNFEEDPPNRIVAAARPDGRVLVFWDHRDPDDFDTVTEAAEHTP